MAQQYILYSVPDFVLSGTSFLAGNGTSEFFHFSFFVGVVVSLVHIFSPLHAHNSSELLSGALPWLLCFIFFTHNLFAVKQQV
jgi:hypothetical protein